MKKDKIIELYGGEISDKVSRKTGSKVEFYFQYPFSQIIPKILPELRKEIPYFYKYSVKDITSDKPFDPLGDYLDYLEQKYDKKGSWWGDNKFGCQQVPGKTTIIRKKYDPKSKTKK